MIRSDVLRELRARKKNSTLGPADIFSVVNRTVAWHLADVPVALPDLTEVLAEVARMRTRLEDSDSPDERMMYRCTYIRVHIHPYKYSSACGADVASSTVRTGTRVDAFVRSPQITSGIGHLLWCVKASRSHQLNPG